MVASVTNEHEVAKVLLGFSVRIFPVAVKSLSDGDGDGKYCDVYLQYIRE